MAALSLRIRWRQLAETKEKPPVLPAPPCPSVSVHRGPGGHGAEVIYRLMPSWPHSFTAPAWLLVALEFTWVSGLKLDRMRRERGCCGNARRGWTSLVFSCLPSTCWTLPHPLGFLRCSWSTWPGSSGRTLFSSLETTHPHSAWGTAVSVHWLYAPRAISSLKPDPTQPIEMPRALPSWTHKIRNKCLFDYLDQHVKQHCQLTPSSNIYMS